MQSIRLLSFIAFTVFILVSPSTSLADIRLNDWISYSSILNVQTMDIDAKGKIWAGTSGGVFIYDIENEKFKEIRNTDGLLSMDITVVKSNNEKHEIYICSADGYIHIVNDDFEWTYITDIVQAKYPNPEISDIVFFEDYAFIAGGFGLTKFDQNNKVFLETVIRFGDFRPNTRVNKLIVFDGYIWAATREGIARAELTKPFSDPQSWETITDQDGLNNKNANDLIIFNNELYVATVNYISVYRNQKFEDVLTTDNNDEISGMTIHNEELYYSTIYHLYTIDKQIVPLQSLWKKINGIISNDFSNPGEIILFYKDYGFSRVKSEEMINILPNSPKSNSFVDLDVDNKGRLWVATKSIRSKDYGSGFAMLDKSNKWFNFLVENNDYPIRSCTKISALENEQIVVSTWGDGYIIVEAEADSFATSVFDTSNTPMTAATSSGKMTITGESALDVYGNLWVINNGIGYPGPILIAVDKERNYYSFHNTKSPNARGYYELAIDQWGTKWLGSNSTLGLFSYFDNGTLADKSDDKFDAYTKSAGLLDNEITDLATDRNGFLWIGTNSGLNFIYDTYPAVSGGKIIIREEKQLSDQWVNDIYVDALNNKWIATNKGIWVLNDDGSEILNKKGIINSSNSPLVNDNVLSITSDPATGRMYFGTNSGLSSAMSLSIEPAPKYNISCYPQPFDPMIDNELIIDGLEADSDMRILTINGELIRSLTSKGKKIVWDGKDESGNYVSSGIYMIVASSTATEGSGTGKFVVIRK